MNFTLASLTLTMVRRWFLLEWTEYGVTYIRTPEWIDHNQQPQGFSGDENASPAQKPTKAMDGSEIKRKGSLGRQEGI